MARDYRTLKLEILAETKQFVDDMKKSENQVQGFSGKMEKFGKVAAAAFAAAAAAAVAYAGKLAIDGVKAALADEAAQARLAKALENVTGATKEQTAQVEKQIEKMSLAFGVADEELRPAFQRLATATGSLAKAQDGLQLALDISAATGKSVEAVSNALGKAYEGNTGALSRLGIGLSSAEIKSLGLEGTMRNLAETFGGAATTQANTLEGQINRLKIGFDETKESVGAALLPAVKAFIDYITNRLIPMLIQAKDRALAPIKKAFEDNKEAIETLWQFTKDYLIPLFEFTLMKAIEGVGRALAGIITVISGVVNGIKFLVKETIDAVNALISLLNRIPGVNLGSIGKAGFSNASYGSLNMGGSYTPTGQYIPPQPSIPPEVNLGQIGAIVDNTDIFAGLATRVSSNQSSGVVAGNTIINISGAIDPVSTARQIQQILNSEASLAGNFADGIGVSRFSGAF